MNRSKLPYHSMILCCSKSAHKTHNCSCPQKSECQQRPIAAWVRLLDELPVTGLAALHRVQVKVLELGEELTLPERTVFGSPCAVDPHQIVTFVGVGRCRVLCSLIESLFGGCRPLIIARIKQVLIRTFRSTWKRKARGMSAGRNASPPRMLWAAMNRSKRSIVA